MKQKIILDLCGGTGAWSEPYKEAGYKVINVTLPNYDVRNIEFIGNFILFKEKNTFGDWPIKISEIYGILAAPPCTQFSKANYRVKKANRDFKTGIEIVSACMKIIWEIQSRGAPLKFWALENPLGYLYNFMGKPAFYFQPWQFGETDFRATKRTAIWGYFKQPVKTIKKRSVPYIRDPHKYKGKNIGWGARNATERAKTSQFFAKAFFKANQ